MGEAELHTDEDIEKVMIVVMESDPSLYSASAPCSSSGFLVYRGPGCTHILGTDVVSEISSRLRSGKDIVRIKGLMRLVKLRI